jgi:hypothetical protein
VPSRRDVHKIFVREDAAMTLAPMTPQICFVCGGFMFLSFALSSDEKVLWPACK